MMKRKDRDTNEKRELLFINPEMTYSGSPRSLLRMCKVAVQLDYNVSVWSEKEGPFISEFEKNGFSVKIISGEEADVKSTIQLIRSYDLAICNTIMTYQFARICCRYIPTVWYIREATNIPYFTQNNRTMLYTLENSMDLYCVSNYAAHAIKKYSRHKVRVIRNCIEDESSKAVGYEVGSAEKVRFFQAGTLEYRKGLDVLLDAYERLPESYKDRSELFFAGRIFDAEIEFGNQLITRANKIKGATYLGELVSDEIIPKMSEMDIVIVPSRDESCSLVALEGAMLSKPLVVTRNVGAKYIIRNKSGIVVETGDSVSLSYAMKKLIDHKCELKSMGIRSRKNYETMANMKVYEREMKMLFERCKDKDSFAFRIKRFRNYIVTSDKIRKLRMNLGNI